MKIQKIQVYNLAQIKQNKNFNNTKTQNNTNLQTLPNAYMDYNINFRGRTPEDFYSQEFNIKNMPQTMKEYLNSDYEKNKHIPPEQIMSESFKYLDIIDNFSDIKAIYPYESLFQNLHNPNDKIRTGLIYEIKQAKEIENLPLFKDKSDNLGVYLLKKIYLEGKTIKEINKDFYEKDINPNYKGVLTEPITQKVTSAYGIQYPKLDFWHSFIATRDEYKKFFIELPKKNTSELVEELNQIKSNKTNASHQNQATTKAISDKTPKRKYKIKSYTKEHLKKDIKNAKNDTEAIKKAIHKHFRQDDPEANFIVKYLSPIMTIAADRIHLSEEERFFAESEKEKGKKVENLFAQFWKAKPELAEFYSTAITDTMDLFEEIYGAGGNIPINKDFEVITEQTENKKVIDYVPKEFVELLNHTQTIGENRIIALNKHNELQNEWEKHFKWKYSETTANDNTEQKDKFVDKYINMNKKFDDLLQKAAKANNSDIITLKGKNGESFKIVSNIEEAYEESIANDFFGFPTTFIKNCINTSLKHPLMSDKFKLSILCSNLIDKIDDPRIYSKEELSKIIDEIYKSYSSGLVDVARSAATEVYASRSNHPENIFKYFNTNHINRNMRDEIDKEIKSYKNNPEIQKELNSLYNEYKKPLTNSEKARITTLLISYIKQYTISNQSIMRLNPIIINTLENMRKSANTSKSYVQRLKTDFAQALDSISHAKWLLHPSGKEHIEMLKKETLFMQLFSKIQIPKY